MTSGQNESELADALSALEAAEKDFAAEGVEPTPDSTSTPQTVPEEPTTEEAQPPQPDPAQPDAPATTEPEQTPSESEKPAGKAKTDYAKSAERRDKSWKELNAEKETFRAQQAELAASKEAFERQQIAFRKQQVTAQKASVKPPEFYEQGATQMERNAETAEQRGDYDTAAKLRVRAEDARALAKELRERKPDPTDEEAEKAFTEETKKWVSKAGIDFPDLLKKGKDAAGNEIESPSMLKLKGMLDPKSPTFDKVVWEAVESSPAGMYYAGRLAHAETVAARASAAEKEVAALRAEVKKLNGKLSVSGGGLPNGQPAKRDFYSLSLDEQRATLEREAATQGRLR